MPRAQKAAGLRRENLTKCFDFPLPRFFGPDGVLCSMAVSDAPTFVISVILILRTRGALGSQTQALPAQA